MDALKTLPALPPIPKSYQTRLLGLAVIVIAIMCFTTPFISAPTQKNSYNLYANFESAEGLAENSAVTLAGINIGTITDITLGDDYTTTIKMAINDDIILSQDSTAAIVSNGIFGSRYLRITGGGFPLQLKGGDEFLYTSKPLDFLPFLEVLITNAERKQ